MNRAAYIFAALVASVLLNISAAARTPHEAPSARELPAALAAKFDSMIGQQLGKKAFPGAAFIVGDRDGRIYARNYGDLDYTGSVPVSDSTLYDVASLTKVISTTFAVMHLYDRGLIGLNEKLRDVVPDLKSMPFSQVTIAELLTHTSGLGNKPIYTYLVSNAEPDKRLIATRPSDDYPYHVDQASYMARDVEIKDFRTPGIDTLLLHIASEAYNATRRGRYTYNDLNFYLLRLVVEQRGGVPLDVLTRELLGSIGSGRAGYRPLERFAAAEIAPTEYDHLLRRGALRGEVHDETALIAGGVGGNAGLFATAGDVANFCEMIVCGGNYRGTQILKPETVELFTSSPLRSRGIYRGYGFDKRPASSKPLGGDQMCGHTGFTGTMFWLDKESGKYMVFLSNSVHPTRTNRQLAASMLRANLWQEVIDSL